MSEDLISRNALLEELKSFSMNITGLNNPTSRFIADQCKKSIMRIVDEQPTAYDVDKVVKQFEENVYDMEICEEVKPHWFEDISYKMVKLDDAIEIVKAGGVNE